MATKTTLIENTEVEALLSEGKFVQSAAKVDSSLASDSGELNFGAPLLDKPAPDEVDPGRAMSFEEAQAWAFKKYDHALRELAK